MSWFKTITILLWFCQLTGLEWAVAFVGVLCGCSQMVAGTDVFQRFDCAPEGSGPFLLLGSLLTVSQGIPKSRGRSFQAFFRHMPRRGIVSLLPHFTGLSTLQAMCRILRTAFRSEASLEGENSEKQLCSQLRFTTVKGYRLKSAKETGA